MDTLVADLGNEVADAEEETFLLYSRLSSCSSDSSGDLGFINPKVDELDIHVAGKDLIIKQFPNLLVSNRAEGTTGAVLWRISPLFADWFASNVMNPLFTHGVIGPHSKVVELGCGVAGVVLLAIAPLVGQYIATDQQYILQHLYRNVEANVHVFQARKRSGARRKCNEADRRTSSFAVSDTDWKIRKLDWETDSAVGLSELKDASMIFAVDCIYNESLVEPFIRTCADICRFRSHQTSPTTLCVIAQQLRSEDVFETFMKSFIRTFHVWRVPERLLSEELRKPSFVVHIGILRTDGNSCIADRVYPNSILAALNER